MLQVAYNIKNERLCFFVVVLMPRCEGRERKRQGARAVRHGAKANESLGRKGRKNIEAHQSATSDLHR